MNAEREFLSPGGIRSISKIHQHGYSVHIDGQEFGLDYQPAEGNMSLFGGNSNWRGPVWMPMNYLIVLALQKYFDYYKGGFKIEFPTGSGSTITLSEISIELAWRLISTFKKDSNGRRPVNGNETIYQHDQHFSDLILFYEYFHGDTARGVGASHQTGWTGIVAELINRVSTSEKENKEEPREAISFSQL